MADKWDSAPVAGATKPGDKWDSHPVAEIQPRGISIPLRNRHGVIGAPGLDTEMGTGAQVATSPLRLLKGGAEQTGKGMTRMAHPESVEDFAGGLSDTARGVGTLALPFAAPAIVANPLAALAGAVFGGLGGATVEGGAKLVGVPDGYAELAGTGAGAAAGYGAGKGLDLFRNRVMPLLDTARGRLTPQDWNEIRLNQVKRIPFIGKTVADIADRMKPTPYEPFKPNPSTARKMRFTPSETDYGPTGTKIPRGGYEPPPVAEPEPEAGPEPYEPFKPSSRTARKMKYTPSSTDYGPVGNKIPRGSYEPPEMTPPPEPEAEAVPHEPFRPNPKLKSKMKYTPSRGGSGMPTSSPRPVKRQFGLPKPPEAEVEPEAAADGPTLTPQMRQIIADAVVAQKNTAAQAAPPPGLPAPPESGGRLYSATKSPHQEITSQIHANAMEMELPGSPAGQRVRMSPVAKEIYGKAWGELSHDQMSAINEFMLKYKRLPTAADANSGLFSR